MKRAYFISFFTLLSFIIIFTVKTPHAEAAFTDFSSFFSSSIKFPKPSKTPQPTPTSTPTPSPSVSILYPNGGETFTEGDKIVIQWAAQDVDNCYLGSSYWDGNLNWIATDISPQPSQYEWTTDFASDTARVYIICWKTGVGNYDDYSEYFEISPASTPTPKPNVLTSPTPSPGTGNISNGIVGFWLGISVSDIQKALKN